MVEVIFRTAALKHLDEFLNATPNAVAVRFSVKKSGCSGLRYVAETIDSVQTTDILVHSEPNCYVDEASALALNGMIIDHKVTKLSSELVYNNPNATNICGCGESFSMVQADDKKS